MDIATLLILGSLSYIPIMGLLLIGVSLKLRALRVENARKARLSTKLMRKRGLL